MQCRPPRKIKRYMTDPDECPNDNRHKYNNLTLQELKLQVSAIDTLNDITVPSVTTHHINQQKSPTSFLPLHPKFHLRRNPLKRLPDINAQNSNNNGQTLPKTIKGPPIFKRTNPLFVVNTLFDILKEESHRDNQSQEKSILSANDKRIRQSNQFSQFEGKSVKFQRGPRLIDSELSRLTQQSNFSRRKIYSEEKSRQKPQEVELLTFYKPKNLGIQDSNQFLS